LSDHSPKSSVVLATCPPDYHAIPGAQEACFKHIRAVGNIFQISQILIVLNFTVQDLHSSPIVYQVVSQVLVNLFNLLPKPPLFLRQRIAPFGHVLSDRCASSSARPCLNEQHICCDHEFNQPILQMVVSHRFGVPSQGKLNSSPFVIRGPLDERQSPRHPFIPIARCGEPATIIAGTLKVAMQRPRKVEIERIPEGVHGPIPAAIHDCRRRYRVFRGTASLRG